MFKSIGRNRIVLVFLLQMSLEVGYWKIRGLGAPLRMMCEYAGAEYTPVLYEAHAKEEGGWDVSEWFSKNQHLRKKML